MPTCWRAARNLVGLWADMAVYLPASNPEVVLQLAGPKFELKFHAVPGTCCCKACNRDFKTFIHLRKHVEGSNCTQLSQLWRFADPSQENDQAPAAADKPSLQEQAVADPGDAAIHAGSRV